MTLELLLSRVRGALPHILALLKPSFLASSSPPSKPRRLHRTAYLDGLRGVAALLVVIAHYEATYFASLDPAWHNGVVDEVSVDGHAQTVKRESNGSSNSNSNVLQLPILRVIYSGRFMVAIFFVISGHVLSQKALGLARRRQYPDLLKSLASSVFRRWFRLMVPALTSSFLFFLLAQCGWVTKLDAGWGRDNPPVSKPLYDGKDLTLSSWATDVLHLANPLRFGEFGFPKYNYPLWTMPLEFMGSMIVFIVVLGTSLMRPWLRLAFLAMLVVYIMWIGRWEWCLFISGVLIADACDQSSLEPASIPMHPLASRIDEEVENTWRPSYVKSWTGSLPLWAKRFTETSSYTAYIVNSFLFVLALYLGSTPTGDPRQLAVAPGYGWLSPYIPGSWFMFMGYFYPDIGAILLVSVLAQATFLQKIFTTRIAQYLGDISLSLYMLHIPVLHTLGNRLIVQCSVMLPALGGWGFTIGITTLSCCAIVSFWAADVFWRLIDKSSVQLTRRIASRAFIKDQESA